MNFNPSVFLIKMSPLFLSEFKGDLHALSVAAAVVLAVIVVVVVVAAYTAVHKAVIVVLNVGSEMQVCTQPQICDERPH